MELLDGALPFAATDNHAIALSIVDLRVAQAFWEGVPSARLLARARLHRDECDLVDVGERASGIELASSTWDDLMARLASDSPAALDRVKRAISRHGRAASDEGPLVASDASIAALVHVLLSAAESDGDSSPAEGVARHGAVDAAVQRACGRLDDRFAASRAADPRAPAFEACLHLATLGTATTTTSLAALRSLGKGALASAPLYPRGDEDVPVADRRALALDRAVAAASVTMARELLPLVSHHGALIAFVTLEPRSLLEPQAPPPSSWLPGDFASPDAATRLASALERGATTAPRARSVILRGGEPALDAISAEMLAVAAHPFASAVFADILGRASRERDVVRLVSYFAIAPDLASAAHALASSSAPEVPTMLRAWLESIAPEKDSLGRSRVEICGAALAPYPHLHDAVKPVLARLATEPPEA